MIFRTGRQGRRNGNRSCAPAFTLIELILVMALLVIVISVSAPSLSKFFHGRVLNSEARRFISMTRYAQSRAISEGVPVELWIDSREGMYGVRQLSSYNENDPKAMEFRVGTDLSIEALDVPVLVGGGPQAAQQQQSPSTPTIRFLPGGAISQNSPLRILIAEGRVDEIWIQQTWNGMHYEIVTNETLQATRPLR